MTSLHRVFRIFWVGLGLILLGIPLLSIVLVKTAEHALKVERHVGGWTLRVHGAQISPFLAAHADSVQVQSPTETIFLSNFSIHLFDGIHLWSHRAVIRIAVDSVDAVLGKNEKPPEGPPRFPELTLPIPVTLECRALNIRPAGVPVIAIEQAQFRTQGPRGLKGRFHGRVQMDSTGVVQQADFSVEARWYGSKVRYRVEAMHATDTLLVIGNRQKKDLLLGEDSLEVLSPNPRIWMPVSLAANVPELSRFKVKAKIDWSGHKLSLNGELRTGTFDMLEPFAWSWNVYEDSVSGGFVLNGEGSHVQVMHWRGRWQHPPAWLSKPNWNLYTADLFGKVRGIRWQIGTRNLPIEFEIPSLHLERGLLAEAKVTTSDSSHLTAHWNGNQPRRLEFAGDISSRETWATIWTDTNLSYQSARVEGFLEGKSLKASAWFKDVLAYGAEVDSVKAVQEVIFPEGYYLREGLLYRGGQVFKSSGQVEWAVHPGRRAPTLAFELSHAQFGKMRFAMLNPDSMEASAENAQATQFPYKPLWHFARFHPTVDGHFFWNHVTGGGSSDIRAVFSYQGKELGAHVSGEWDRDSLYLRDGEIQSGSSRLTGKGTAGLRGLSLAGLSHLHPNTVGSARLVAENLHIGEVLELVNPAGQGVAEGLLDGNVQYDGGSGWRGDLHASDVSVPSLRGILEVKKLSLSGQGDSLRISATTTSTRHPLLVDTVEARVFGLRSESPGLGIQARSGGLSAGFAGEIAGWKEIRGNIRMEGRAPLGGEAGFLDGVLLDGALSIPMTASDSGPRFSSRNFHLHYAVASDTQWLEGHLNYAGGLFTAPDLRIRQSRGGGVNGRLQASLVPVPSANFEFAGTGLNVSLPGGQHLEASGMAGNLHWKKGEALLISADAQAGFFKMNSASSRIESGFEKVRLEASIPPAESPALPKILLRGRTKDFLFQRKVDVFAFFRSFRNNKRGNSVSIGDKRPSKPWEMDLQLEAVGTNNRVDTDVLRLAFLGDMEVKGVYPYTLFNGKLSGLRGEIGLSGVVYEVRDFEVKWENATLDEGRVYAEGNKKVLVDCEPDTRRTCNVGINLNGALSEMNFGYDTDCEKTPGETNQPISPASLITWAAQGCASVAQQSGANGGYGGVTRKLIDATSSLYVNTKIKQASNGIIEKTKVSGISNLVSNDTSGFEPVAVEVQTREKYRTSLKGKMGYFPERKLSNPWEGKLGIEYRPPLENLISDSLWQARIKDRWTVEASVETRPSDHPDVDEQRQVRQQAGLRYHYRFWDWW